MKEEMRMFPFLSDEYVVHGKGEQGFKDALHEFGEATHTVTVDGNELTFFQVLDPENALFAKLDREHVEALAKNECLGKRPFLQGPVRQIPWDLTLLEESQKQAGYIINYDRKPYYLSAAGHARLCGRFGISGDIVQKPSLFLSELIAKEVYASQRKLTLVYRDVIENGIEKRKIFSVMSDKFCPIPAEVISKILAGMTSGGVLGNADMREWTITHTSTGMYCEYPEATDEFTEECGLDETAAPGLIIRTSDTGDSAIRIHGTFRVEGSKRPVIMETVSRKHIGEIDPDEIVKMADQQILAKMKNFPEALAKKMGIVVGTTNPALSMETESTNRKLVTAAIKHGMKELGLEKVLGKRRCKKLEGELIAEINPGLVYTEYTLASMFMKLPDRVDGISDVILENLQKACGRAPFVDYKADVQDEAEAEEVITLLPAM